MAVTIEPMESIAALGEEWRALEARARGSFFLSWVWIETWLEESAIRPLVLRARDGAGAVIALALLNARRVRRHHVLPIDVLALHESGDEVHDSLVVEYNDLLVDDAAPAGTREACLEALAQASIVNDLGIDWNELRLSGVSPDWLARVEASGLDLAIIARRPHFAVDLAALADSPESYLASLGASTRHQIRRALRHYAARGPIIVRPARDVEEALSDLAELQTLHQAHWIGRGKQGAFATPFFARFHRRLIARALPLGGVEVLHVHAGRHTIGYLYNFLHRGTVHNYLSGFAFETDPRIKPGLVSHALAIDRHRALGRERYDLMAGEARYKNSLAARQGELVWIAARRAAPVLLIEDSLRAIKRGLMSLLPARRD